MDGAVQRSQDARSKKKETDHHGQQLGPTEHHEGIVPQPRERGTEPHDHEGHRCSLEGQHQRGHTHQGANQRKEANQRDKGATKEEEGCDGGHEDDGAVLAEEEPRRRAPQHAL